MSKRITLAAVAVTALAGLAPVAHAAPARTTQVVTEADVVRQVENTPPTARRVLYAREGTPASAAAFVDGPSGQPLGSGSLRLETATGGEKVFLLDHAFVGRPLAGVNDISYSTYRTRGAAQQVAALNVVIDVNGPDVVGGFSTLVFEPVYNPDQGAVVNGTWQKWTASGGGQWWSTRTINNQPPGAVPANFRSWDQIKAANPDATVLGGVGVNQGSGNGGLVTNVDAFRFADVLADFERIKDADGDGIADTTPPTSTDQCKQNGYKTFNNPAFKTQGDCVSFVNLGR